jgi:1-acyl-sn-glycerol-3-phosphate acyltransferase
MGRLVGTIRIISAILLILGGAVLLLPLTLIPFRWRGARLSAWWITLMARVFNRIFDVRFYCTNPSLLRWHRGLLFPNHSSYLDIMAMLTTAPVRFLSADEMRRRPVVGWMAQSVETVFVDRTDSKSRRAARRSLSTVLATNPYPPIVIFPEGRLNPGTSLFPFRYGAFDLAVQNEVAFVPVALRYNRPDVVTWYGGLRNESLVSAVWRLAVHRGRIVVDVIPLDPVQPTTADDPALLAAVAQRAIEETLGFPPGPTSLHGPKEQKAAVDAIVAKAVADLNDGAGLPRATAPDRA